MRCLEFVSVPSGTYRVGSTEAEIKNCVDEWASRLLSDQYDPNSFEGWIRKEAPVASVGISEFEIGRFPVTNEDFKHYLRNEEDIVPESILCHEPDDHPVWGVTRESAKAFARWLSRVSGDQLRLPSEFEWEISARGIFDYQYPYGNEFDSSKANTFESNIRRTTPVDLYEKFCSSYGVVDMAGNVEEWVSDDYAPYSGGVFVEDDLSRTLGCSYPLLRGGSFARGGDLSRCARRHGPFPSPEFRFTGFRLVKSESELNNPHVRVTGGSIANQQKRSELCTKY